MGYVDTATGILVFLTSVYFFMASSSFTGLGSHNPGSWPKMVTTVLMVLGAVLAVQGYFQQRTRSKASGRAADEDIDGSKLYLTAALLFAYVVCMKYVGFLAATFMYQIAMMRLLGSRNWLVSAGLSLAFTVGALLIFNKLLFVPVPRGVGAFRAFSLLFY